MHPSHLSDPQGSHQYWRLVVIGGKQTTQLFTPISRMGPFRPPPRCNSVLGPLQSSVQISPLIVSKIQMPTQPAYRTHRTLLSSPARCCADRLCSSNCSNNHRPQPSYDAQLTVASPGHPLGFPAPSSTSQHRNSPKGHRYLTHLTTTMATVSRISAVLQDFTVSQRERGRSDHSISPLYTSMFAFGVCLELHRSPACLRLQQ